MTKCEKAKTLFKQGYNCTQAVVGAFEEELCIPHNVLMSLSSSFGGGMGRLREVCGAVTGAFIVLGVMFGYDDPAATSEKAQHYKRVQEFAKRFKSENGSYVCRELLGLDSDEKNSHYNPEPRSETYYKKRPCAELCGISAEILEKLISEIKSGQL